jgi:hypothetical protein
MANAEASLKRVLTQDLFEIGELAGGATQLERGSSRTAHGDACRIIAAIFQPAQPLKDDGDYLLFSYIANNAAHGTILSDGSSLARDRNGAVAAFPGLGLERELGSFRL